MGGRQSKRQVAALPYFWKLPSNTVLCRAFRTHRTLQFRGRTATDQEIAMAESAHDAAPSGTPPKGGLDASKEIATYLNRDVTTVQHVVLNRHRLLVRASSMAARPVDGDL
jgi:hypothetical protein